MPTASPRALSIGLITMHTSVLDVPGRGDAGGLNVQVLALAHELSALGHSVQIFSRRSSPNAPSSQVLDNGTVVHQLSVGPQERLSPHSQLELCSEFAAALCDFGPFDVLHSHYWLSALAAAKAADRLGCAHITNFHSLASLKNSTLAPGDTPESPIRLLQERRIASTASVISGSERERQALIRDYGAPADQIHHIPPGVDLGRFHPGASLAEHPELADLAALQRPYLLVLGRIQPIKGQELALRSYAALHRRHQEQPLPGPLPHLVIAGEALAAHQGYANSLRTLSHTLNIAQHVHFLGAQTRAATAALFANATLSLVPSFSETFGLVSLESAACGTPVLAQRTAGLSESVSNGHSGVLLDSRDPQQWGAKLHELFSSPDVLAQLSDTAIAFARSHSWHHHALAVQRLYAQPLNAQQQPLPAP